MALPPKDTNVNPGKSKVSVFYLKDMTPPYQLLERHSGSIVSNWGVGANCQVILPAIQEGLVFHFVADESYVLAVHCLEFGDRIEVPGDIYCNKVRHAATRGGRLTLTATSDSWTCSDMAGIWELHSILVTWPDP